MTWVASTRAPNGELKSKKSAGIAIFVLVAEVRRTMGISREGRVETVYQKSSKYSDEHSYRIRQNLHFSSERMRSMLRGVDRVLTV